MIELLACCPGNQNFAGGEGEGVEQEFDADEEQVGEKEDTDILSVSATDKDNDAESEKHLLALPCNEFGGNLCGSWFPDMKLSCLLSMFCTSQHLSISLVLKQELLTCEEDAQ